MEFLVGVCLLSVLLVVQVIIRIFLSAIILHIFGRNVFPRFFSGFLLLSAVMLALEV